MTTVPMGLQPRGEEDDSIIIAKHSVNGSGISFVEELDTLEVSSSQLQDIHVSHERSIDGNNSNHKINGDNNKARDEEKDLKQNSVDESSKILEWIVPHQQEIQREQQEQQRHKQGEHRTSTLDLMLTDDELVQIFDDVFMTPEERHLKNQITLKEIAEHQAFRQQQKHSNRNDPYHHHEAHTMHKSPNFLKKRRRREILGIVVMVLLLALTAWAVGYCQSGISTNDTEGANTTTTITTTTHVVSRESNSTGSILEQLLDHPTTTTTTAATASDNTSGRNDDLVDDLWDSVATGEVNPPTLAPSNPTTAMSMQLEMNSHGLKPNAIPGSDVREYWIGSVNEPIQVQDIQVLLDHHRDDWTTDLVRVRQDPCAPLDASDVVRVQVHVQVGKPYAYVYQLQCGIKVDSVPLTIICAERQEDVQLLPCSVYTVGVQYCDKFE